MVSEGESQIEIALDRGEVKTPEHQEAICELELELLSGKTEDVLALAVVAGNRRAAQGSLSKAARGYHLAQGNDARPVQPFGVLQVAPKASVEQGLEASLENALAHWLYHDEVWSRGNPMAKGEILRAIAPDTSCAGAVWRYRAA